MKQYTQALYLAEQKAREAVETRARIQHEILNNQKDRKEDELRKLAQQARINRVGGPLADSTQDLEQTCGECPHCEQFFCCVSLRETKPGENIIADPHQITSPRLQPLRMSITPTTR